MGKPEKQYTVQTKVGPGLHRRLRFRAAREDKKLHEVVRAALEKYLDEPYYVDSAPEKAAVPVER